VNEPEVVERVRTFLRSGPLPDGRSVRHLVTDAHHTLLDHGGLGPYQRITLAVGDRASAF
jgi:hypothetical protein